MLSVKFKKHNSIRHQAGHVLLHQNLKSRAFQALVDRERANAAHKLCRSLKSPFSELLGGSLSHSLVELLDSRFTIHQDQDLNYCLNN